ncbi:MAG: glycosyltransferase family 2 protein, partial [Candidatus Falkowbacteria bacterium]|nr:glycosyltransferase family 2 protein [Candidatus Falkowbacteria bacterium]
AANNLGIKFAIEDGCEYFVIANMDTSFSSNWLSELILAIDKYQNVGIVQSKILLYPKDGFTKNQSQTTAKSFGFNYVEEKPRQFKINSLGNIIHFLGFGYTDKYGEDDKEISGLPEIKGYASGCSFMIKKEIINKIEGYNEEYFMYHDDMEISLKVKIAGYKIFLASKSIVYHKYEFSRSVKMVYFMERNRYLIMFHFYGLFTLILLLPIILVTDLGMLFFSIYNGWFIEKIKVYKYFLNLKTWKKINEARKKINSLRKMNDNEVLDGMTAKINFQEINNPVLNYIANPIFKVYFSLIKKIIK